MQFFYLFSFVVVASYAAALPQPAGLSEKYSNNVDTALASGLEARSYQPVLNSYKNSATLVSLKRRGNSGSDSPPSPDTTPENIFIDPFTKDAVSSENLASTINNVGDGIYPFLEDGELAGEKIGDDAGDMVARYIRMHAYVNVALGRWVHESVPGIRNYIKLGLGDDEYSRIDSRFTRTLKGLEDEFYAESKAVADDAKKIVKGSGSVTDNFQKIHKSFVLILETHNLFFYIVHFQLTRFEGDKALQGYLDDISKSFHEFLTNQKKSYAEIMEKLKVKYPQE
ncbi:hypothetical protein BASA83_004043 [Batrachochytrium salamandrivorans]|nr:hypothetical protein BASA81_012021 [Batrachochytrium salamandrivorans]KAH9273709.1 hypothetical protein BASA83_004043 [Batrachochytrium salamandrivorans]